ncbi:MAG: response regulator [Phascolarctobacterium sp.]|nr:response regulator [Phascolarctobacterium sp.]
MSKRLRILLADDEAILRLDLREMLTEAGHEIAGEAANGEEAVNMARSLKPDFIIMDVKMPGMDGITAAEIIASENIAPVLLLTAYSQQDIVDKAKDAGVIGYLVKPVREEQLFPAMEIAVSRFAEIQTLNKEVGNLKESLETRKLLDRAKGILMTAHGMTEQEAYRKMQQFSMSKRITLKELAEKIIDADKKRMK